MTRDEAIQGLVARKCKRDQAVMYVDAWMEYRVASENIERNGPVVSHPRSGRR